jgi:hypothetical protein
MILVGDVVMNAETRAMAKMIRANPRVCGDIRVLLDEGLDITRVAARLKHRVCEELRKCMAEMHEFTRAAMATALRSTIDWQAVVQFAAINPEDN